MNINLKRHLQDRINKLNGRKVHDFMTNDQKFNCIGRGLYRHPKGYQALIIKKEVFTLE